MTNSFEIALFHMLIHFCFDRIFKEFIRFFFFNSAENLSHNLNAGDNYLTRKAGHQSQDRAKEYILYPLSNNRGLRQGALLRGCYATSLLTLFVL